MVLLEIERQERILTAICYRPGLWSFTVYETGAWFDWFSTPRLDRVAVTIGTLYANNTYYTKRPDITSPPEKTSTLNVNEFCQIGNTVYARSEADNPLWLYPLPRVGVIEGHSDERKTVIDGILYNPDIDYIPEITDEADDLEYGTMEFKSETITLKNTAGHYDQAITKYFGSKVRVRLDDGAAIHDLYEYYVKNAEVGLTEVSFKCGDPRERLRQQIPGRVFNREEFPYIKEDLLGEPMRDAYGRCEWVPCVCVDDMQIYADTDNSVLKDYRTFYIARKIISLTLRDTRPDKNNTLYDHVWIKQTQPDSGGEVWTPCQIEKAQSDFSHGLIRIMQDYCMPLIQNKDNMPEVYEVCACGVFGLLEAQSTPFHIIQELLLHYCGIPQTATYYDNEMSTELTGLKPVGVVYDENISVFEAIEMLQDASNDGLQFMTKYTKWTARKDNDLRTVTAAIKWWEIVNIGDIRLDMNIENYKTIVKVPFAHNWYKDSADIYSGENNRESQLSVHGVDSIYEAQSFLTDKAAAVSKADALEQRFKRNRVSIEGLEVLNHPWLRVYDIVTVDLSLPEEGRHFGGTLKCKVMGVKLNLKTLVNTLNLLETG
jgi:hypothetical protein